jgi:hypothetical protein
MNLRTKNYDLQIVFVVTMVIAVILITFKYTKEFGVNLFTEIAGVAITVFVINKILERKERQRRIVIDQRILRELQSIIASYYCMWKHLIWKYYPKENIRDAADIARLYPLLLEKTNVKDQFDIVSSHQPESWKLFFHNRPIKGCFENHYEVLSDQVKTFVNDFKAFLEPELLDNLLNVLESDYFRNIYTMSQEETEKTLLEWEQDPTRLDSYIQKEDNAHLSYFTALMAYSSELKKTITKFDASSAELYEIRKYFIHPSRVVSMVS